MLQVAGVVAAGGVGVAPGQLAPAPVLHAELLRQQPRLQGEVQQETAVLRGQLVVQLRVVTATAPTGTIAGTIAGTTVATLTLLLVTMLLLGSCLLSPSYQQSFSHEL